VRIHKLFAILVALAVLVAPSAAFASAQAAAPHHNGMQAMEMGHCQTTPSNSGDHSKADRNCCIAMCLTLAVAPTAPADAIEAKHAIAYFTVPQSWHGYLGEIATPPPRSA
jgi:hypothetical protein